MKPRRVRLFIPSLLDQRKKGVDYGDVGRHRAEHAWLHRFLHVRKDAMPKIRVEILKEEP